jgi:hypothetical protein
MKWIDIKKSFRDQWVLIEVEKVDRRDFDQIAKE